MTHAKERLGLTPDERRAFEAKGLIRLQGAVSAHAITEMADRLWSELARKDGIRRRNPSTWRHERLFGFQALQASGAFKAMASPPVRAALNDLIGHWVEPADWGQPLVCFPSSDKAWRLPRQGWHFDGPIDPAPRRTLIGRVFLILEPLQPRGGATLVATGSHRIATALADAAGAQQSSSDMRRRLQALHPWFEALMHGEGGAERTDHYLQRATTVLGVPLRIEEMTGAPGDVWLMHHNALHAASPNALDAPRLALSQFVEPRP